MKHHNTKQQRNCKSKSALAIVCLFFAWSLARAQAPPTVTYPKVTGYVGIVHPLVTFSKTGTTHNFNGSYTVGMPAGINIWKNAKVGFSMEFIPFIRATDVDSRVSTLLFHPGALFALGKGFTLATRAAFETSGRYGFTPVLTKTVIRNRNSSFYASIPMPARFGNSQPSTFSLAFHCGVAF